MTNGTTRAFSGGPILTMDPAAAAPQAVIVQDGRIVAVGERALLARYPDAAVEDLAGRTLLPGFIDAHNHLSIAALHPRWADLSGVTNLDELRQALAKQAAREAEARWVRGVGWTETVAGVLPDRHALDALAVDRPVIVVHFSLHQCVVNSQGLDELEIGRHTPDPPGGMIVRDGQGNPTGLLVERAWSEAHARSLADYRDPDRWADLIATRCRVLIRDGITCVHDAACAPAAEMVYQRMRQARALPMSVLMMPHAEAILTNALSSRLEGPLTGAGDEQLRVGPMKFFADGGIAPAVDAMVAGQRFTHGVTFDDLAGHLVRAVSQGFRVAVHAMGNLGLTRALEAFAAAARVRRDADHRFRVEHATLASPAQATAMTALGAVGVVQPGFLSHMGQLVEGVTFDREIWLPFGELARAGVRLAGSSDDPCGMYEPLRACAHGTTRRTGSGHVLGPEQALGYEEWLRAYTAGAAHAGGQENERGTLSPGKRADFTVLEGRLDPLCPPRVAQTWIAGELVYAGD